MIEQKNKSLEPELEADIYYLTEQEGGRKSDVRSGYRGQFFYDGNDWDASQEFMDKDVCVLGDTVAVRLITLSPLFHVGQFYIGKTFEVREGKKIVGHGKITKIVREDFNYWDFDSFFTGLPSNCSPYDEENIDGFIMDFEYGLAGITKLDNLKFSAVLANNEQMLTVQCVVSDSDINTKQFIEEVCKRWIEKIQFKKSFYKIKTNYANKVCDCELIFATRSSMYLTGKIVISY